MGENVEDILTRKPGDKEALRKARNERWAWIHNCIQMHKAARHDEARGWEHDAQLYRSECPDDVATDDSVIMYDHPDDADEEDVQRNELYAFIDQLVATVCPPNPEVTVRANRKVMEKPAKFRQALINDAFRRETLAVKLWRATGRAGVFPRCFFKVTWSHKKARPRVRVVNPHFVFYDEMASEWDDVRYVCEVKMMTRGEFMAKVKTSKRSRKGIYNLDPEKLKKVPFGQHQQWMRYHDSSGLYERTDRRASLAYKWIPVYEYYDLVSETLYHYVEGVSEPIYEAALPYQLHKNPYYMLVFNDNLRNNNGLSDAKLVRGPLTQANTLNTLMMWALRAGIPIPVVMESLLDDPQEFMTQLRNAEGPHDVITLAAQPRATINDIMGHTPVAQMPVEWSRMTGSLLDSVANTLGIPSYARGSVGNTDVATEAALAGDADRTRKSRRQKVLYLAVEWIAEAIIRLYIEYMPNDSSIPLRVTDDTPEQLVSRRMFGFGMPDGKGRVEDDDPWDYSFSALPFNGDEDNRVVRLRNLMEVLPSLVQNPEINQRRLWSEVLDMMKLSKVLNTPEEAKQAMQAMMPPPVEGEATPAGPDDSAEATTELGAQFPQLTGAPDPTTPPLPGQGG